MFSLKICLNTYILNIRQSDLSKFNHLVIICPIKKILTEVDSIHNWFVFILFPVELYTEIYDKNYEGQKMMTRRRRSTGQKEDLVSGFAHLNHEQALATILLLPSFRGSF